MEVVLVSAGVIAVITCGVGGSLWLLGRLLDAGQRPCPACRARKLDHTDMVKGRRPPEFKTYKCLACGAGFREHHHDGLVPLEAWERGARVPPPVAIVRT